MQDDAETLPALCQRRHPELGPGGADALGGRRQMRVAGTLNDADFTGSTMLVAGGGLCVGVSKAMLKAAGADVGDAVRLTITPAAR